MVRPVPRGLILLACLCIAQGLSAEVKIRLDRDLVRVGETFQLIVEVPGQNLKLEPDLSPLAQSFEVLGQSRSTRVNVVNGQTDARTSFHIELTAKQPGEHRIALLVGAEQSNPVTLKVIPRRESDDEPALPHIFLEAEAKPVEPYVQSQVTYTVRLFHSVDIREGSLSEPELPGAVVERLGDDVTYEVPRDGKRYRVIERRYAIFPQASGVLTVPPPVFSGQVPDNRRDNNLDDLFGRRGGFGGDPFGGFFHPTRPVRALGPGVDLSVRAAPSETGTGPWLPAASLSLKESWTTQPLEFRVGEPATRTLTIVARGLTGAQLPDLELGDHSAVKIYPDQPVSKTFTEGVDVIGRLELKLALVPTQAGTFTLPEIKLRWWDTRKDQARDATIPARSITVLPAVSPADTGIESATTEQAPAPSAPTRQEDEFDWRGISIALLLAWLSTVALWLWERGRHPHRLHDSDAAHDERTRSENQARESLEKACREDAAETARDALLVWAAARWKVDAPLTLVALAARLEAPEARAALAELDRILYSPGTNGWNGASFLIRFRSAMRGERPKPAPKFGGLPELYPQA